MKRTLLSLVALGIACSDAAPPAPPGAPFNTCSQTNDCAGFNQPAVTCTDHACVVPAPFNGALVVSMPITSFYAPGQTMVISSAYLASLFSTQRVPPSCTESDPRPACSCRPKGCLFMPTNGAAEGTLQVSRAVAALVWPSAACASLAQTDRDKLCGLRPQDGNQFTSMPSRIVFRPLWSPDAKVYDNAGALGLPVPDVEARAVPSLATTPGPNNTPGTKYDALLQQSFEESGASKYVLRFDPLAPFDAAFPPIIQAVAVKGTQGAAGFSPAQMTVLDGATFRFTSLGPDLSGWKVYLVTNVPFGPDKTTPLRVGERVSSVGVLGAQGGEVTIGTDYTDSFGAPRGKSFDGLRLVAEPPAGSGLPTYANDNLAGAILTEHTIPPCADPKKCAALPPPVTVRGTVLFEGRPRTGRVWFVSQRGEGTGVALTDGSYPSSLSYATEVVTDASGAYSALLPPGNYDAFVQPDARDAAKTALAFSVGAGAIVQQGKSLALARLVHVHGTVSLADGRPVGDARVTFTPTLTPPMGTDARALPRAFAGKTTIANGVASYDLDVDPGVYDVTVAPVSGTNVPWIVSTARAVGGETAELEPLVIGAPSRSGLTLLDPFGNPITGALVRAFEASQTAPSAAKPAPLYEVGRTTTDSTGHFDLYLGPAPK